MTNTAEELRKITEDSLRRTAEEKLRADELAMAAYEEKAQKAVMRGRRLAEESLKDGLMLNAARVGHTNVSLPISGGKYGPGYQYYMPHEDNPESIVKGYKEILEPLGYIITIEYTSGIYNNDTGYSPGTVRMTISW